jgi:hypothetical protein
LQPPREDRRNWRNSVILLPAASRNGGALLRTSEGQQQLIFFQWGFVSKSENHEQAAVVMRISEKHGEV